MPTGTFKLVIGRKRLSAVRSASGGWVFTCPAWPDLAKTHNGCSDASACIEEFTRRAAAAQAGKPKKPGTGRTTT